MRTGLTKIEKTTDISFDESSKTVYIRTHNTDLKNRLTAFAEQHPDLCRMTEDDVDIGCKSFEIDKRRFYPSDSTLHRGTQTKSKRVCQAEWLSEQNTQTLRRTNL